MKTHFFDFMQKDFTRSSFDTSKHTIIVHIYYVDCMIMQTMKLASSYSYSQLDSWQIRRVVAHICTF